MESIALPQADLLDRGSTPYVQGEWLTVYLFTMKEAAYYVKGNNGYWKINMHKRT